MITIMATETFDYDLMIVTYRFEKGRSYVISDDLHEVLLDGAQGKLMATGVFDYENGVRDENGPLLIFLDLSGIGDTLAFMPVIPLIRQQYPCVKIDFVVRCLPLQSIILNNPAIDRYVTYPIPLELAKKYRNLLVLSHVGFHADFARMNIVEFYMRQVESALGINLDDGIQPIQENNFGAIRPFVDLDTTVMRPVKILFDNMRARMRDKVFVYLQWRSSTPIRDLPLAHIQTVIDALKDRCLFFFGIPPVQKYFQSSKGVVGLNARDGVDLSKLLKDLRALPAIINECDIILTVDTATLHVAQALRKPTIALFGPVPAAHRVYTNNITAIDADYSGETCHSPCHLSNGTCQEMATKHFTEFSPCMAHIEPERVIAAIERWLTTMRGHVPRAMS